MSGYENSAGLNVHNHYGTRDTGYAIGVETGTSGKKVLRIDLTGKSISDGVTNGFVPPVVLPKGAKIEAYKLRVDEAFALGGTTPTVLVGAEAAPGTNGVVLSKAELEAVGTKTVTSTGAGTWAIASATGTTVASLIGFGLGGTTPTVDSTVGKGTLWIEYIDVAKA